MPAASNEYLISDELRLLTNRGAADLQIDALLRLGVRFELDHCSCPLVRYDDAKQYFLLMAKPLTRGLPDIDR